MSGAGMITPYLLLIKIGAALLLCAALFAFGYHKGGQSVQAEWDAQKVVQLKLSLELTQKHSKEVAELTHEHNRRNRDVSNTHQDALKAITADLAAARRAVRSAGGLRVSSSICSSFAANAKAAGDIGNDAAIAGTVALPDAVTEDLFSIVAEADKVTEVARSCQDWVRKNGFYGGSDAQESR